MSTMRAKLQVNKVTNNTTSIQVEMWAVCGKPFDKDGNSEDNTFAQWTPCANLNMTINNPVLFDKIREGQKFYVDFTEAAE